MSKYVTMMRLQGNNDDQMMWLASSIGRLYETTDRQSQQIAALKARITKLRKSLINCERKESK
jgi:hypothetical protein